MNETALFWGQTLMVHWDVYCVCFLLWKENRKLVIICPHHLQGSSFILISQLTALGTSGMRDIFLLIELFREGEREMRLCSKMGNHSSLMWSEQKIFTWPQKTNVYRSWGINAKLFDCVFFYESVRRAVKDFFIWIQCIRLQYMRPLLNSG